MREEVERSVRVEEGEGRKSTISELEFNHWSRHRRMQVAHVGTETGVCQDLCDVSNLPSSPPIRSHLFSFGKSFYFLQSH